MIFLAVEIAIFFPYALFCRWMKWDSDAAILLFLFHLFCLNKAWQDIFRLSHNQISYEIFNFCDDLNLFDKMLKRNEFVSRPESMFESHFSFKFCFTLLMILDFLFFIVNFVSWFECVWERVCANFWWMGWDFHWRRRSPYKLKNLI